MRVLSDFADGNSVLNIACDIVLTCYNLGQLLLKRQMTMISNIRKNKSELLEEMQTKKFAVHYFLLQKPQQM